MQEYGAEKTRTVLPFAPRGKCYDRNSIQEEEEAEC
jgi:hypothetical protein